MDFLNEDQMIEIAKLIDNSFCKAGYDRSLFDVLRIKAGYWNLGTTECDDCSFVRIWSADLIHIDKIEVLGKHTGEHYQLIHDETMQAIMNKFPSNFKDS